MPNHGLTFTPRGRGRVGSPWDCGRTITVPSLLRTLPLQGSNVSKSPRSIPFFFIFLRTLLHIFALMQNSTHLFSSNSVLFAQYTRGTVMGRMAGRDEIFSTKSST